MITRRGFFRFIRNLGLAGLGLASYGLYIEPGWRLAVRNYAVTPPRWPADFRLRIVILSDIHAGAPLMPATRVEKIVNAANTMGADLFLLLGDYRTIGRYVTERVSNERVAQALQRLKAPLGVHAILGNRDWWDDPDAQWKRNGPTAARIALENENIPVYENDGIRLEKDGQPFWLLGLGDSVAFPGAYGGFDGIDDLPATLARVTDDAPVLLMMHEPDSFVKVPDRVSLCLAGHTHGGQVNILGWTPFVPSAFGNRFRHGHIIEENRHLIVSAGLGCSTYPVRFGVPPEVVVIDLGEGTARI